MQAGDFSINRLLAEILQFAVELVSARTDGHIRVRGEVTFEVPGEIAVPLGPGGCIIRRGVAAGQQQRQREETEIQLKV